MNVLRKDFWKTQQIECLTVWVWNVRRRYGFLITFLLWSWEIKRLEFSSGWMRKLEIGLYSNVPECYKVNHSKIEWLEGEKNHIFFLAWLNLFQLMEPRSMGWAAGFGPFSVVRCPCCMLYTCNPSARVSKTGSFLGLTGQSVYPIGEILVNEDCLKGIVTKDDTWEVVLWHSHTRDLPPWLPYSHFKNERNL